MLVMNFQYDENVNYYHSHLKVLGVVDFVLDDQYVVVRNSLN